METIEQGLARAIALLNAGQPGPAESCAQALLARDAGHPAVHQLMAVLCERQQRWDAARAHITRSLAARSDHWPSLMTAVRVAQASHDTHGLQAALQQALRVRPDTPDLWFALSLACHALHERDAEAQALQRTLALQPDHVEANVNLGIVAQERGNLGAAMACYGRAYRLRNDSFGRIANALCSEDSGALWLNLDALREALRVA